MNKKALIMVVLASLLWGTSGIFVHYLSPFGFNPMQIICMRGTVAALCMSIYALIYDRSLFVLTRQGFVFALFSGASMFLCGYTYYAAMEASSVSTAVVLMYTAPVLVMAFSVAFMGERLTLFKLISIPCMLLGCCMVSGIFGNAEFGCTGIFLGILSSVFYSTYNIFTKFQMRKNFNPAACTMYCFIVMSVISIILSNPAELADIAGNNLSATLPLAIGLGVCTSVLPYFLYTLSLRKLHVGTASALSIIEPISATVYSVAFLGEKLTVLSLIGIIMIIMSVFLLSKTE